MRYIEFLSENRIDWLRQTFLPKLKIFLEKNPLASSETHFYPDDDDRNWPEGTNYHSLEIVFNKILSADPTQNKEYAQWIFKQFLSENVTLEDLYKVHDDLVVFHQYKHLIRQKDINKYESPVEVWSVIKPIVDQTLKSKKQVKKTEIEEIRKDIDVLYNGPEGKIYIPKTEEASCLLGRGTRWCTAATKSRNAFRSYFDQGPLYIIFLNDGQKFQFHFQTNQFMDEEDNPIDLAKFNVRYKWVFDVFRDKFTVDDKLNAIDSIYLEVGNTDAEDDEDAKPMRELIWLFTGSNGPDERKLQRAIIDIDPELVEYIDGVLPGIKEEADKIYDHRSEDGYSDR